MRIGLPMSEQRLFDLLLHRLLLGYLREISGRISSNSAQARTAAHASAASSGPTLQLQMSLQSGNEHAHKLELNRIRNEVTLKSERRSTRITKE